MEMRLLIIPIVIVLFLTASVNAQSVTNETIGGVTHWYVSITESMGVGTGDPNEYILPPPPSQEEEEKQEEGDIYYTHIYESIYIKTNANQENKEFAIDIKDSIVFNDYVGAEDTNSKIPTWVKVLIWVAIVLVVLGALYMIIQISQVYS